MHPNALFRRPDDPQNALKASLRGFGVLAINAPEPENAPENAPAPGGGAPLLSHIPFVLPPNGDYALAHLVRSNPIAKALKDGPLAAVLAVTLGDCYVSPDWYTSEDQVPTWNYRAIHLRGSLELRPQDELLETLAKTSAEFEARLAPKPAWTLDKMSEKALGGLMKAIVPVRLNLEASDATEKLSQNKNQADINGVITALGKQNYARHDEAGAAAAICQAMQALPPKQAD